MYPLLANYVGFYSMCTELGLDPGQIGKFLQGYDTKIMETDRELWRLTTAARAAGLDQVFASNDAGGIHTGAAPTWESISVPSAPPTAAARRTNSRRLGLTTLSVREG